MRGLLRRIYLYFKGREIWNAKMSEHLEITITSMSQSVSIWDTDYTKLTPSEKRSLEIAGKEMENGEYFTKEEVWSQKRRLKTLKPQSEATYWRTNKEWYKVDYDTGKYELTLMAPPRAVKSFRLYQKQSKIMAVLQKLGIK